MDDVGVVGLLFLVAIVVVVKKVSEKVEPLIMLSAVVVVSVSGSL